MGADSIYFTLDGSKTFADVQRAFEKRRRDDAKVNGHRDGYSGDFQTVNRVVDGSVIGYKSKVFKSWHEALDYCLQVSQKWETVTAVKYLDLDNKDLTSPKVKRLNTTLVVNKEKLQQLQEKLYNKVSNRLKKLKFIKCQTCKSNLNTERVLNMTPLRCPLCQGSFLTESDRAKRTKLETKIKGIETTIQTEIETLKQSVKIDASKVKWLIAGWGAC